MQQVHEPVDLWDITFCATLRNFFWNRASEGIQVENIFQIPYSGQKLLLYLFWSTCCKNCQIAPLISDGIWLPNSFSLYWRVQKLFQVLIKINNLDYLKNLSWNFEIYFCLEFLGSYVQTICTARISPMMVVKFIYSEKATKFCEIFTLLFSYVVPVKSKISKNVVAF